MDSIRNLPRVESALGLLTVAAVIALIVVSLRAASASGELADVETELSAARDGLAELKASGERASLEAQVEVLQAPPQSTPEPTAPSPEDGLDVGSALARFAAAAEVRLDLFASSGAAASLAAGGSADALIGVVEVVEGFPVAVETLEMDRVPESESMWTLTLKLVASQQ